jgi:hypothetical protein
MTAVDTLVQKLSSDSGFQLMNDVPLLKEAFIEVETRLDHQAKAIEDIQAWHNARPTL